MPSGHTLPGGPQHAVEQSTKSHWTDLAEGLPPLPFYPRLEILVLFHLAPSGDPQPSERKGTAEEVANAS